MDEAAERERVDGMRRDLDDLRRVTAERRLAEAGTPEYDALERREAELIAIIRSWPRPAN